MKRASIALTREHLRILGQGKAVTVRLPDAEVLISIHPDARLAFSLDRILDESQQIIDQAKGRPCRRQA